jgi:hypothetical protein
VLGITNAGGCLGEWACLRHGNSEEGDDKDWDEVDRGEGWKLVCSRGEAGMRWAVKNGSWFV